MKRLFVWVMLVGVIQASTVFAAPPSPIDIDEFKGLGKDRETLTPELIAWRSARLEANANFYLLRFPQAAGAPARIFDPGIWQSIQLAAALHGVDPMVLAGMIYIESFGDALAKSPTGPAGIAQLTKSSAKEMGLVVGKKIRVGSQQVTKTRYVGKGAKRRAVVETKMVPVYRTVDERYEPGRAIGAMARRLANRRSWLGGKTDFAIAEYHMGAGRMAKLLSAYFGRKVGLRDVPTVMGASPLTYPDLFWTNTPYFRPAVYKQLDELNRVDFSPTYYFRVRQAMRLLELYRRSPSEYEALASSYRTRSGQPGASGLQWSFVSDGDADRLTIRHQRDFDNELGERIVSLPPVASQFGVRVSTSAAGPVAAERSTIGCLLFVAHQLERLQGVKYKGFETNSLAMPLQGENGLVSMHTLGWAFDLPRKPLSKDQIRDLNFILTDLRLAGLLAVVDEGKKPQAFHVVRHPEHAGRFEQFYWNAMAIPQASRIKTANLQ